MKTFENIKYSETTKVKFETLKEKFEECESLINQYISDCREKSLAITNLEQSFMWVSKALRNSQTFYEQGFDKSNGIGGAAK